MNNRDIDFRKEIEKEKRRESLKLDIRYDLLKTIYLTSYQNFIKDNLE